MDAILRKLLFGNGGYTLFVPPKSPQKIKPPTDTSAATAAAAAAGEDRLRSQKGAMSMYLRNSNSLLGQQARQLPQFTGQA